MVLKEVLRLHPPAPLPLPRETLSHFKLNGYDIDPKTHLHVINFQSLPFGGGRRNCPEEDMDMEEDAGLTVAKLPLKLVPMTYCP
ncbi:cytochrome P450 71B26-like [Cucumis melo var. makuwa]|uniref:Cytochrome P450 71B26-like n=1 Tax=Cucumis melo var. makuwa TaxID=1194695 RepID=A0A5D3CUU6_CUCMM|nr:cytochrome P450 71B26-like [Cucumis melo var. makuwa]